MWRVLGWLGCWMLLGAPPASGEPGLPRPAYRFEHLTVDQGLAHSDALAVAQDAAGFLWVGTNKGIDRYDGHELHNYTLPGNALNGMPTNRVRVLHLGPDGRLWAGVESSGLGCYNADHNRFEFVAGPGAVAGRAGRVLAQSTVVSIVGGPGGQLWVGTEADGLFALRLDGQGRLLALRRVPLPGPRPVLDYHARALALGPDGRLWMGTIGAGLLVLDTHAAAASLVPVALGTATIRSLCLDRRGDLWVGTDHQVRWLSRAAQRTARPAAPALPQPYTDIESVLLDSFGRLWVATTYGLHLWEAAPAVGSGPPMRLGQSAEFLPADNDPTSINSDRVHQVFEDRNQVLWLAGGAGGLNKVDLRQKPFFNLQRQVSAQPTLANSFVNAIYKEEARQRLWIGTRNGLSCYDLASHTYHNYLVPDQPGKSTGTDVSALLQTADSALWIATINRGLWRLRFVRGRTALTPCPGGDIGYLESLAQDRFGTVWAASMRGLSRFGADGRLLHTYQGRELPTSQFTYLLYDRPHDVLWASTRNAGLLKLRVTADSLVLLRQFPANPTGTTGLAVSYLWPLLLDRAGTLWIGTIGGGLHRLVRNAQGRETIERYRPWLPESDVETILADADGNLWIGGTGLYRFNPRTRQHLRYDVADGLQSNSFKVGAAWPAQDGTLYFGGINGLTYFQPRAIQANPYPPLVQLTELRLANKPVTVGEVVNGRVVLLKGFGSPQTLVIKAQENDFSIGFVDLNYANPNKHRYAYRLVGYNKEWVPAAPGQRSASFANLDPGDYTFLVKASNGEGLWSVRPAALRITVLPPWWRSWWAYLLYALAALGVMALYRRVEMAQQKLKNQLVLEEYRVKKEKELTDLKLSFFTNVSHELRTPLTLILGPMEELVGNPAQLSGAGEKLTLMHKQTRKLLDLVNQLLDFRKAESGHVPLRVTHGDIVGFLTEIFLIFKLKAEEKGINYSLEAPADAVPLYFDRNKLEIILTNLLANAFKYTAAGGRVRVSVAAVGNPAAPAERRKGRMQANYLEIRVIDEGIGMAAEDLQRIFDPYFRVTAVRNQPVPGTGIGLALVKQAVERHAGEINVASTLGTGTTFTLRLPFGRAHLAPSEIEVALPDDGPAAAPQPVLLPTPAPAAGPPPATPASRALLLIVEDNDEVRHYLHQLFAPDFEVALAADGVEGWEKALALLPDLVISDVMMPRRDGLELCRQLKQHPKTAHIPVMLLTARTAAVHELAGLETGADDYSPKPFNPQVLHAKALTLLANRRQLREYYQRQLLLEPTQVTIPETEKLLLESAMRIVEAHLNNPDFGVPMLVKEVGMSQSVFYRRIKAITGRSVAEFIRDVRMKRSAQLLAGSTMRVSDVAYEVGFEDIKHFREAFRKIYDLSPSEYAKQHRPVAL